MFMYKDRVTCKELHVLQVDQFNDPIVTQRDITSSLVNDFFYFLACANQPESTMTTKQLLCQ